MQRAVPLLVATLYALPMASQGPSLVKYSEESLRDSATNIVRPQYPASAARQHQMGVAVAQVYFDEHGVVEKVLILEAPSEAIADSVRQALMQWRFGGDLVQPRIESTGRLTYYFRIFGGKAMVLEPKDAPYMGRW